MVAGGKRDKNAIVSVINQIGVMNAPIVWPQLEKLLNKLVKIGPSMKVWGRLLCIVNPDLFCTVASISVRRNLSQAFNLPQTLFGQTEGYVKLLRLIHSSPWFNSPLPVNKEEVNIWSSRVAFMDAIFYDYQM